METDPDVIFSLIQEAIVDSLQYSAPIVKIQIKNKSPNFLTPETKTLIMERDAAHDDAKISQNHDDIRKFKNLRNQVRKAMKRDKSDSITQKMDDVSGNPRAEWNAAKNIMGWTVAGAPSVLTSQGKTLTKTTDIANAINVAILTKTKRIQRNISKTTTDPLQNYSKLVENKKLKFTIENITIQQLNKIMNDTKASGSTALDQISMRTLKNIYPSIKYPLLNLINSSISTTIYPQGLKTSKVIPLLKKDKPPNNPESYRGINILPSIGKLQDKLISIQIQEFLTKNKLVSPNHHGGIKLKSTITAAASLIDDWSDNMENKTDKAVLILDQSAAFDTICHKILINKLAILGFDPHSLQYMQNYLSNRNQTVQINGTNSNNLYTGPFSVIQGSTLSCLLFLIYTLDLPTLYHDNNPTIQHQIQCTQPTPTTFVDDTTITVDISNPASRQQNLNSALQKVKDYMDSNKLSINPDKTKLFVISQNPETRSSVFLDVQPTRIVHSPTILYLGIPISQDLKME